MTRRRTRYAGPELELPTRPTPPAPAPAPAPDVPVQLYSVEDAAARLAVSEKTIKRNVAPF